ncbi:MAG: hypothetical protein ACYC9M_08300 [Desulfobulbaceae bacterium]
MKQCSLDQFCECIDLWLAQNYIRGVIIDPRGRVTFTFMDGIKDTYEITGCDRAQVKKACRHLSEQGVPVKER